MEPSSLKEAAASVEGSQPAAGEVEPARDQLIAAAAATAQPDDLNAAHETEQKVSQE